VRLDHVYSLAQLERFAPAEYLAELEFGAATTLAELAARDTAFVAELAAIDAMIARAMKLRLELVDALAPPTRNVFATTIVQYARQLDVLQQRVYGIAPAAVPAVMAAATELLDLRAVLRAGIFELVRDHSAADTALADAHARDRKLDDGARKQWSRARRDLEALALDPTGITTPTAQRHAAYPELIDDAATGPEPTFADMIELD
jgi:phage tail protein X